MAAGKYSFLIEQGASLNFELNWVDSDDKPLDLTGYQGRMHIRPTLESETIYLSLTSSLQECGTGINFSGSSGDTPVQSGSIGVFISAKVTENLNFTDGVYDLEVFQNDCEVTRLIEGKVKLSKNVTR